MLLSMNRNINVGLQNIITQHAATSVFDYNKY